MAAKYIIDGPPGSGKTTLLFGKSGNNSKQAIFPSLSSLGCICVEESAARAHFELEEAGLQPGKNREAWLARIVEMERDNYLNASEKDIQFFDRSFHYWTYSRDNQGLKMPEWYDEFNARVRYSNPVFLCHPFRSIDLTIPKGHRTRSHTIEERQEWYQSIKSIYKRNGYDVVELPVFSEGDQEENNKQRIKVILDYIKKDF